MQMDFIQIKKYCLKVKDSMLESKNKEFLTFLFFLFVSAVFWLLQSLNEPYDVEIKVPLAHTNIPNDVVITSGLPDNLQVNVRDKGTALVRYLYGAKMSSVEVDYNQYDKGFASGHVVVDIQDVRTDVQSKFQPSTRILSVKPDTLEYFYNKGARKKVAVRMLEQLSTRPDKYVEEVRFEPDSVDVLAPTAILDTISAANLVPMHLPELSDDYTSQVMLSRMRGVKFIPDCVVLNVIIDTYTEKSVEVPIKGINFPHDVDLKTFPSKVTVLFRVGMSRFKYIDASDFELVVDYNQLSVSDVQKVRLKLKTIPDGASNIRISPSEVDFLLEHLHE